MGVTCVNLLSQEFITNTDQTPQLISELDYKDAANLLKELDQEDTVLQESFLDTEKLNTTLKENERLRRSNGGYTRAFEGLKIQKVINLTSALRDQNPNRAWQVTDRIMSETEHTAVRLHTLRKKYALLERQNQEANAGNVWFGFIKAMFLTDNLKKLSTQIDQELTKLHRNYTAYRALRETFESSMANNENKGEQDLAARVYQKVGLSSAAASKLPSSVEVDQYGRPTIDFIRTEYHGLDFPGGTQRHFGHQSLIRKIQIENAELKSIGFRKFFVVDAALQGINLLSQALHKAGNGTNTIKANWISWFAKKLDYLVIDIQNRDALKTHLAEIYSIQMVPDSRKLGHFQKVLANFINSGSGKGFDFLTSFERAQEYQHVLKRISLEMALRHVDKLHLIEDLFSKEQELHSIRIDLDIIQRDLQVFKNDDTKVTELNNRKTELLRSLKVKENELSETNKLIDEGAILFQQLDPKLHGSKTELYSDQQIYKDLLAARERASNMGALSYEYSPGSQHILKMTSAAIVFFSIRAVVVNTPLIDLIDAAFYRFGIEQGVPELSYMWSYTIESISGPPTDISK